MIKANLRHVFFMKVHIKYAFLMVFLPVYKTVLVMKSTRWCSTTLTPPPSPSVGIQIGILFRMHNWWSTDSVYSLLKIFRMHNWWSTDSVYSLLKIFRIHNWWSTDSVNSLFKIFRMHNWLSTDSVNSLLKIFRMLHWWSTD